MYSVCFGIDDGLVGLVFRHQQRSRIALYRRMSIPTDISWRFTSSHGMIIPANTLPTHSRTHIASTLQDELNLDKKDVLIEKGRAFAADTILWCNGIGNHDPERLAKSISLAGSRFGYPRDSTFNDTSRSMVMAAYFRLLGLVSGLYQKIIDRAHAWLAVSNSFAASCQYRLINT